MVIFKLFPKQTFKPPDFILVMAKSSSSGLTLRAVEITATVSPFLTGISFSLMIFVLSWTKDTKYSSVVSFSVLKLF